MKTLSCPTCGSTTTLRTIAKLTGSAGTYSISRMPGGGTYIHPDNTLESNWEDSETIGVRCTNCDYSYEGPRWADQLLDIPTVEVRVAAALSLYDPDELTEPAREELVAATTGVSSAALRDPRVALLTTIVSSDLPRLSDDTWAEQLTYISDVVPDRTPTVVEPVLAAAAH